MPLLSKGALSEDIAIVIVGAAIFELAKFWQGTAPKLADLRSAEHHDISIKQKLVDADVTVGIVTIVAAGAVLMLSGHGNAALLLVLTFVLMSWYYHSVLAAPSR